MSEQATWNEALDKTELRKRAGLINPRGLDFVLLHLFGVGEWKHLFERWVSVDKRKPQERAASRKTENDARIAWAEMLRTDPSLYRDAKDYCDLGKQVIRPNDYIAVSLACLIDDMEANGLEIVADRCNYNDDDGGTLYLRFDQTGCNNEQLPNNIIQLFNQQVWRAVTVWANPWPVPSTRSNPTIIHNGTGWDMMANVTINPSQPRSATTHPAQFYLRHLGDKRFTMSTPDQPLPTEDTDPPETFSAYYRQSGNVPATPTDL